MMTRRILLGAALVVVLLTIGLFVWVRAVFTTDTVRVALATQLSAALGQPVTVGSIAATIYPRVTVNLGQVAIGNPPAIQIQTLHVGTAFRALLSRRIEHATLELSGAQVQLPLPAFTLGSGSTSGGGAAPVEIVSIDAIVLHGVEIVSGGRRLTADAEVVPEGNGLALKRVTLLADNATIDVSGRITDLSGPVGKLAIKADALNLDRLLAFATDFATGSGLSPATPVGASPVRRPEPAAAPSPPMDIVLSLAAERATMGTLALDRLAGEARITADTMTLAPIGFGVFGGRYDGSLAFSLTAAPGYRVDAAVTGVDMAAATAFADLPGLISGRMSGKLNLTGQGLNAGSVISAARGSVRLDVTDGVIKNLGLIRSAVVATSGRADAPAADAGPRDGPFSKFGATLMVSGGAATTNDLRLESTSVLLDAGGTMRLDGSNIDLVGQVQLSDELTAQAGRDLVRYTQENGRVTLPATITGTAASPQVRIDLASMAKRALVNRASEEAQKALKKGLGRLFER
jgi:uncharacterized protein involved in outer membrane biogenesis